VDDGGPCFMCGVRAAIACRHRPAFVPVESKPPEPEAVDKRRPVPSGGGRYRITGSRDGTGNRFHKGKTKC
jgi:hypothetical protein